jgi:glc operon protein GlcG
VPLQGGLPIVVDGQVIGAVGVSGASSADEDEELAVIGQYAGAGAAVAAGDAVLHVPAGELAAKFETGGLLVDAGSYKVDAGRRTAAGDVELHRDVVDVMHVVKGRARVVTGGAIVGAREVSSGELRGDSIDGGQTHELGEGDVLVVPAGQPHQFVETTDPFLYFVTKVER